MSYNDLKTKIRLKTEEKMADVQQDFENLLIVASKALGGSKKDSPTSDADPATAPKSVDQLEHLLSQRLG